MSKTRIAMIPLLAAAALLAACSSSGPKIKSDYDRTVDFGQYTSYNFFNR